MKTEMTVSAEAARAALAILVEYLAQGGASRGVRDEDVEEFICAMSFSDRIVIAE